MRKMGNEVETDFKSRGTHSFRVTMPILLYEEWVDDCRNNFNDTYYLKMMFDHQFRKEFEGTCALLVQDVLELRDRVAKLSEEVEILRNTPEEPKRQKTFGGN